MGSSSSPDSAPVIVAPAGECAPRRETRCMQPDATRPAAAQLLKELGTQARLVVYVSFAPGAGKSHRLLTEARQLQQGGHDVALGWIETKGRTLLEQLAAGLPRIPPRTAIIGTSTFPEFDYEATLKAHPQTVVLDELAHTNLPGSTHAKRWQDALALRDAGISVLGAFNIAHLETIAPSAEAMIGFPIREIVPYSFLKTVDQVIAIDIAPEQLEARLRAGAIVREDDVERALQGPFRRQTLNALRAMMLRTIDELTEPTLPAARVSKAVALLEPHVAVDAFVERVAAFADAFNLALNVLPAPDVDESDVVDTGLQWGAQLIKPNNFDFGRPKLADLNASFVGVPTGSVASALVKSPIDRDLLVVGPSIEPSLRTSVLRTGHLYSRTAGDRLRVGYGRLTVYLGAAAGCGKTFAMLDQAHQLKADGVDVVVAFVETHGRVDTARKLEGLESIPRRESVSGGVRYSELDLDAVLARKPQVALIDELAHTNAPGSKYPKRYEDVFNVIRSGISVLTTLNVQHLEGLNDAVRRLTGVTVRETMPDGVLEYADDVVLIDASAQTLRDRLRAGKIYPKERIDAALSSFFRPENLTALRELALREALRSRSTARKASPVSTLVLGVAARERDTVLIQRAGRLAKRLNADFIVAHVAATQSAATSEALSVLRDTARTLEGSWTLKVDPVAARGLVGVASPLAGSTIVIEGVRSRPGWLAPKTFAQQVLEAGANELLVLAPIRET